MKVAVINDSLWVKLGNTNIIVKPDNTPSKAVIVLNGQL